MQVVIAEAVYAKMPRTVSYRREPALLVRLPSRIERFVGLPRTPVYGRNRTTHWTSLDAISSPYESAPQDAMCFCMKTLNGSSM